jgi:glucose-1-phosphate adenylyltransferase
VSQVLDAEVTNSILGDGCVVRGGTTIKHSVIGLRSLIGENCHIEDALIMGCAAVWSPWATP